MRLDPLRAITLSVVEATPRTRWTFLEVETEAGLRGVGEASLMGSEAAVAKALARLAPAAFALRHAAPAAKSMAQPTGLPRAAAASALDLALWDIAAQRRGLTLAEALGGRRRARVDVYANINRRTLDRSPPGFAASARAAIAAGHRAIKLAPFDEVKPGAGPQALAPGLARIAAVREAVGPEAQLLIDCHWRLDAATAPTAIAASAELGVAWIECPFPETPDAAHAIAELRTEANRRGISLAGLELGIGVQAFEPYIRAGSYDVMMPDIKYMGGLGEVLRLADVLHSAGIGFSPHNPSGPVGHAASLHLCAVAAAVHSLEVQFDETRLFAELVGAGPQEPRAGTLPIPSGPGLGAALLQKHVAQHRTLHWHASRSITPAFREGT